MISDVKITGMHRVMGPQPNQAGFSILAFFECDANDFHFRGCAFVRTPRGGLTVWPPKVQNPEDSRRNVSLRSEQLREDMVTAVQETYRALGGTDGEYASHDDEEEPGVKRLLGAVATS